MTTTTDLLPLSQRATALFRALPFSTLPLLNIADLRELSEEKQLKDYLGLLRDEETRDHSNPEDVPYAMFPAATKNERSGKGLSIAFQTVMRYRIIDVALFKDGKTPLRAPTLRRELQDVKLPTLSKLPIDKLFLDTKSFIRHASKAIASTSESSAVTDLENAASTLSSERLFNSICKRSKGRAMDNVFLNFETAAFHLKFLLEGNADLPDSKAGLENYFRERCKLDDGAWSFFNKDIFELKGPLYIAMAVSPLMLLATRNLQNNPPGKEALLDFWLILGQYERPRSVLDAERELWSAIWDIAGGMDTSSRLQKALDQVLISDFEDVKDWHLYKFCQECKAKKIGKPSNALPAIDYSPTIATSARLSSESSVHRSDQFEDLSRNDHTSPESSVHRSDQFEDLSRNDHTSPESSVHRSDQFEDLSRNDHTSPESSVHRSDQFEDLSRNDHTSPESSVHRSDQFEDLSRNDHTSPESSVHRSDQFEDLSRNDHTSPEHETPQPRSHSEAENEPGSEDDKSGSGREESSSGKDKSGSGRVGFNGGKVSRKDKSSSVREESNGEKGKPGTRKGNHGARKGKHKSGRDKPDARKDKPDARKDKPDARKDKPDARKDKPDARKDKPDARKDKPDARKDKPDARKDKPDARKDKPVIEGMDEEENSDPGIDEALVDELQSEDDDKSEDDDIVYLGIAEPQSVVLRDQVKLSDLSLPDSERQRKKLPRLDIHNGSAKVTGRVLLKDLIPGSQTAFLPSAHSHVDLDWIYGLHSAAQKLDSNSSSVLRIPYSEYVRMNPKELGVIFSRSSILVTGTPDSGSSFANALKSLGRMDLDLAEIDQSIAMPEEEVLECNSIPPYAFKPCIRHRVGTLLDILRSVDEEHPKALNALDIPPCISTPFPYHPLFSDQIAWDNACGKIDESYPTNDMRWSLATTAWAQHKWHADSNGFATFIKVETGTKIWFIGTPKRNLSPSLLSGGIERILGRFDLDGVNSDTLDIEAVVLTPNNLLFMRPNTLHAVVTPLPSVVRGGHFYATSSIRATCYGIYDDFVTGIYITNTSHSAASNLLISRLMDFYFLELTTNTGDEGQTSQEGHCPDLENFPEVIDLFTFLHLIELSNVISYWNYEESTTPASVESRLRAIQNRRLARKLKRWFFARYSLNGLDPAATAEEVLDHKFLAQQAKALLNYKTLATERGKDKDGVEGIIITGQINITPEVLDQAIRDCLANTRAYDYYIKSDMETCTFAWCEPYHSIKKRGMDESGLSKDTLTVGRGYLAGLTFGDTSFFQTMEHKPSAEEIEEDEKSSPTESEFEGSSNQRKRKQRSVDISSPSKRIRR
ncbi:hypothetical protein C0992_003268 [Termitomyces sp. T32_za158]|nr:hypothetical protein C0992_003268 [Termitomyces sp. T32_za158]